MTLPVVALIYRWQNTNSDGNPKSRLQKVCNTRLTGSKASIFGITDRQHPITFSLLKRPGIATAKLFTSGRDRITELADHTDTNSEAIGILGSAPQQAGVLEAGELNFKAAIARAVSPPPYPART